MGPRKDPAGRPQSVPKRNPRRGRKRPHEERPESLPLAPAPSPELFVDVQNVKGRSSPSDQRNTKIFLTRCFSPVPESPRVSPHMWCPLLSVFFFLLIFPPSSFPSAAPSLSALSAFSLPARPRRVRIASPTSRVSSCPTSTSSLGGYRTPAASRLDSPGDGAYASPSPCLPMSSVHV